MSRLSLLSSGMQGVDMKSNPLFLSQHSKLASATNLQFVEGVLRTRPGIRYESLNALGKFQGYCEFLPARGISAASFSDDVKLQVCVVDGVAYCGCDKISGPVFKDAGPVHIYQAENYLIFQNPKTSTYWWDGETFTESPGINEQLWNDPDMPETEVELRPLIVEEEDPDSGLDRLIKFIVVDNDTEARVEGATWTVRHNNTRSFYGTTPNTGRFQFVPVFSTYTYTIEKEGYVSVEDVEFDTSINKTYTVRLKPIPVTPEDVEPLNLVAFLTVPNGSYDLSDFFGVAVVPPGNAYRTKWRIHTDGCGAQISYAEGDLNDDGELIPGSHSDNPGFNSSTKGFQSNYLYPDGMYLQVGVLEEGDEYEWLSRPCIDGAEGTDYPDVPYDQDFDSYTDDVDDYPTDPFKH